MTVSTDNSPDVPFGSGPLSSSEGIGDESILETLPRETAEPIATLELAPPRTPLVGIIMGSISDWKTMRMAATVLEEFDVPYEKEIVSAHRTPARMAEYGRTAAHRGLQVIIAGAGGAAHLPGMVAAHTCLPVLGVPVESAALKGIDSLLSIVQMPGGIPVGTLAIGEPGAKNAAFLAVSILALNWPELSERLQQFRIDQTAQVLTQRLPDDLESAGGL